MVGPWGDSSMDMHHLIRTLGEHRVLKAERSHGEMREDRKLGVVIGHIRRVLSSAFVRAQGLCLLSRLRQLGPHARGAAERRAAAQQGEAARRAEAQGHWLAHVRGRGLSRVGMVFTP